MSWLVTNFFGDGASSNAPSNTAPPPNLRRSQSAASATSSSNSYEIVGTPNFSPSTPFSFVGTPQSGRSFPPSPFPLTRGNTNSNQQPNISFPSSPFPLTRSNTGDSVVWVSSPMFSASVSSPPPGSALSGAVGSSSSSSNPSTSPVVAREPSISETATENEQDMDADYDPKAELEEDLATEPGYIRSSGSRGDFFLPRPHKSKKVGITFRVLPGPEGVVSNKLFRPRHRDLANFDVSAPQHPKRWNYGVQNDWSQYNTPNSLSRLQKAAMNRERARAMAEAQRAAEQPSVENSIELPYPPTESKPKPLESVREEIPTKTLALGRALPPRRPSTALPTNSSPTTVSNPKVETRPAVTNASEAFRAVLRERDAKKLQQAHLRARAEMSRPKHARPTSANQVAFRRSAPLPPPPPPTEPFCVFRPSVDHSSKVNHEVDLIEAAKEGGFELFRRAFWQRYERVIQEALPPASGYRVSAVRISPLVLHAREAFLHRMLQTHPCTSAEVQLSFIGTHVDRMDSIIRRGLLAPSATNGVTPTLSPWISYKPTFDGIIRSSRTATTEIRRAIGSTSMFVCAVQTQSPLWESPPMRHWSLDPSVWLVGSSDRIVPLFIMDFEAIPMSNVPTPREPDNITAYKARQLLSKRHTAARELDRATSRIRESSPLVADGSRDTSEFQQELLRRYHLQDQMKRRSSTSIPQRSTELDVQPPPPPIILRRTCSV